jgi:hypothetical protein
LPEPSPGDIFFDLEGDPFADPGGLEYLFGWSTADGSYEGLWAFSETEEKAAFEQFIDWAVARRQDFPGLHIFHFGIYEETALKKLMGKYATREIEVDILLRGGVLIDLHRVIRQTLRAGIEKYSLKDLEVFYGFERELDLRTASQELRTIERVIERSIKTDIPESTLDAVKVYNKDDCVSTLRLRDWLEQLRAKAIEKGAELQRPENLSGVASEELNEKQEIMLALYNRLTADIPVELADRSAEQQARFLLANMLDWYWREKKAAFWEFYCLKEMPDDELMEEKAAISGLSFTGLRVPDKKSFIDRYSFPAQEFDIRAGDKLKTGDGLDLGEAFFIDADNRIIDIRKGPKTEAIQPTSIFKHSIFMDQVKMDAIHRLANWVIANGMDAPGYCRAGRDLLLCYEPRSASVPTAPSAQEVAIEWCQVLDEGVLPVQGPPGAGKSHSAAQMILRLIRSGKKIGVTSMSHKVIVGLLEKVLKEAKTSGMNIGCIQKVSSISSETDAEIIQTTDNKEVLRRLISGEAQIAAGTSWLWAREEMAGVLDVLFVDEAGQLSLIDTLVCSQAAHNLVLLGDPQQLKQPQQGSHPDGTEVSALEHLLKGEKTISAEKGVFLNETWRMHPNICAFISELFYESRLHSRPDCINQVLQGNTAFTGAGLSFVPVKHEGNQNCSVEEAAVITKIVDDLTKGDVFWTNKKEEKKPLKLCNILIIAPYNAQVSELVGKLPAGARIGTVDKFQGQEAPVVIFSMSTSTPAEAPRGMEFLYSLNRLNVAVSRAQTASIIVANPLLFEPDCRMPSQMKLANGFCRYLELASEITYD